MEIIKFIKIKNSAGFTYFGFLFLVMLLGLGLSGASLVWQAQERRQKEKELLFVGQQYVNAIASYYNSSPGGLKKYPKKMTDLFQDSRFLIVKRHLRKPWIDPLTNKEKWGIVYTNLGGIAGVYSLSQAKPLKQSGFFGELNNKFFGKRSYQDWKFVYLPSASKTEVKDFDENEHAGSDYLSGSELNYDNEEFVIGIGK